MFIIRDLFYIQVLFTSDCHSPDLTPAYDSPSTDQASSAILSLYSRALAVASSMACHNTGINLQDGRRSECKRLSEPWIKNMDAHRLSLRPRIDEF